MTNATEFIISVAERSGHGSDAIRPIFDRFDDSWRLEFDRGYVTELRGVNQLSNFTFYGLDFLEIALILTTLTFLILISSFSFLAFVRIPDSSSHAYHGPILRGSVERNCLRTMYGIVITISERLRR